YGARYYKSELGRFMQADVVRGGIADPLSLNRYVYVKNNPLKYIDPSGNADGDSNIHNFINKPVDNPINWGLRKIGESFTHLSKTQGDMWGPNPLLAGIGEALTSMGQPTSLKQDMQNGDLAGVGGMIRKVYRGDVIGKKMLSKIIEGEPYYNKNYGGANEFAEAAKEEIERIGIEKVSLFHVHEVGPNSNKFGLSTSWDKSAAEVFYRDTKFERTPEPQFKVFIEAKVDMENPLVREIPYGKGDYEASDALSYEREIFVGEPLTDYKILKLKPVE
ncbi:MAG: hypothetical protein KKF48_03530, partial [Nanoarchaeota archaeon]|nr:hypothetical protein [Nanoarchaeota archaeon]MBU1028091.1 hypothetical protein [Nanoarchaeota archaeon]